MGVQMPRRLTHHKVLAAQSRLPKEIWVNHISFGIIFNFEAFRLISDGAGPQ